MSLLPLRFRTDSQVDRFHSSYEERGGCWLWDGALKDTGYGHFCMNGRKESAHRAAWMLLRGAIPDGLHVLHKCDVRNCVNPDHLMLGTHTDNMRDMAAKGRAGVRRGEESHWCRLTRGQVEEARQSKESGAALARRWGVAPTTIYAIRRGRTWRGAPNASA